LAADLDALAYGVRAQRDDDRTQDTLGLIFIFPMNIRPCSTPISFAMLASGRSGVRVSRQVTSASIEPIPRCLATSTRWCPSTMNYQRPTSYYSKPASNESKTEEELLDGVVDTITANRNSWLGTMMDEELHLQPVQGSDILRSAFVITLATLVGHLIPLLPFVWLARTPALVLAIALSALVLFGVGVYSAVTLVGDWRKSGLKMLVIGLGAAGIGFLIGNLFHA
jgi:hypothetical protein